MDKYKPLWEYISKQQEECFYLSFEDIKNILGFPVDHSLLNNKKNLENYGYKINHIFLKEKKMEIIKI